MTTDVNAKFAETKFAQMNSATKRVDWLQGMVKDGKAKDNGNGTVTVTEGWDRGETFRLQNRDGLLQDVIASHGLDTKANGETALYLKDEPAWHSLGQVIPGGLHTAADVLKAAGLDWEVGVEAAKFMDKIIPGKFVTYRKDTMDPLGVVGNIYTPFQNLQSYSFLDELLEFGMVAETAGSWRGGTRTFISARIPEDLILDPDGIADPIRQYLMISNSHDGTTPVRAVVTPWRPVCRNTERFALRDAKTKWSVRHTKNAAAKVEEAKRALKLTHEFYTEWVEEETKLLHTEFAPNYVDALINQVWGEPDKDATKRAKTADAERRNQIHNLFSQESNRSGQNAYSAERAVTEYVDHFVKLRPRNDLKGNILAALGQAILEESQDDVKTKAHDKLMLLVK
jgi:phage/plasmid-like protein (TIGR03299 family)